MSEPSNYLRRTTAKVGDLIDAGNPIRSHRVTSVHRTPGGGRVEFYGVDTVTTGLPNAYRPSEVVGIVRERKGQR